MNKKEHPSTRVKRPAPRSQSKEKKEEKTLNIFCKPSKVVGINEFLQSHVREGCKKNREALIREAGFAFLLDLTIDDPSKNEVMLLVRKRWGGHDINVTADHVQTMYGAGPFGKIRIDLDATWSEKAKWQFREELGDMGITPSGHSYVKTKDLDSALRRMETCVLNDEQWVKIYILYALSVFLIAPTTDVIGGKYWQYIVPLTHVRNYNWMEHIALKANVEFARASDALKDGMYIKMGGNAQALLDCSTNSSRRAKTINVPPPAAKLPIRRPDGPPPAAKVPIRRPVTNESYNDMSLDQLYKCFYKLHVEIEVVQKLIAEKEKAGTENDEGSHDIGNNQQYKQKENPEVNIRVPEGEEEINVQSDPHVQPERKKKELASEVDAGVESVNPEVQYETKRKELASEVEPRVESSKKKVRAVVEDEVLCSPWDTQFIAEVSKVVDKVCDAAKKSKTEEANRGDTVKTSEELPVARKIREARGGPHTRTPFTDPDPKKMKKKEVSPRPKKGKAKKVVGDSDVKVFDERPDDFVDAPPREHHTELMVTPTREEAARTCFGSLTEEQKNIILHYALDNGLFRKLSGEFVVYDRTTYLSREDVGSLRPRQWVSSAVVDCYARAKSREIHYNGGRVDRIVLAGHVANTMFEYVQPDAPTQDPIQHAIQHCSELAADCRASIEEAHPYLSPYIKDIPYLIIPHCDNQHFTVYVIDTRVKGCFILDSWKHIGNEMLQTLIDRGISISSYLAPFFHQFLGHDISDYDWKLLRTVPKQDDTFSCGLFAAMFAKHYTSDWADDNIPKQGWADSLDELRKDICREIVLQPDNINLPKVLSKALSWFDKLPKKTKNAKQKILKRK